MTLSMPLLDNVSAVINITSGDSEIATLYISVLVVLDIIKRSKLLSQEYFEDIHMNLHYHPT